MPKNFRINNADSIIITVIERVLVLTGSRPRAEEILKNSVDRAVVQIILFFDT